jgi:hypothetical protein
VKPLLVVLALTVGCATADPPRELTPRPAAGDPSRTLVRFTPVPPDYSYVGEAHRLEEIRQTTVHTRQQAEARQAADRAARRQRAQMASVPAPVQRPAGMPPVPADWPAIAACIRAIESGGNYAAVNPSGRYRGAYQFDLRTWASVGGTGDPAAAAPAEQDHRAYLLWRSRGLQPWPTPARRCG